MKGRRHPGSLRLLLLLTSALILAARKHDELLHPEFRAEDSTIFFAGARWEGPAALLEPYEGYWHTLPRLIALALRPIPLRHAPLAYDLAAALVHLLVIWRFMSPRMRLPGGGVAALALVLLPHGGWVFLHLTDLQTPLAFALLAVLISEPPRGFRESAGDLLWFLAAATTGPFVAFFAPLFLWRLHRRRDLTSALLALGAVAFGALQTHRLGESRVPGSLDPGDPLWLQVVGLRFAGIGLLGEDLARRLIDAGHAAALAAASSALVLAIPWLMPRELRRRAGPLPAAALLLFAATAWAYRNDPARLLDLPSGRYSFIPMAALMAAAIAASFSWRSGGRLRAGLSLLIVLGFLNGMRQTFFARESLRFDWEDAARFIGGDLPADIAVEPYWTLSYRPEAEGIVTATDARERIIALCFESIPSAFRPDEFAAVVIPWNGRRYLGLPPDTAIGLAIPEGNSIYDCRVAVDFAGAAPGPESGIDVVVNRLTPEGRLLELSRRPYRPVLALLAGGAAEPMRIEVPIAADERGTLVLRAERPPDATPVRRVLWSGGRFRKASEHR